MATASKVISIAAAEVGYSRWTDPQTGTKYGRWYAQKTGSSYFGQNGVPYCAMFVAWVLAQAGQSCAGMPTASCGSLLSAAKKAGIVRSNKKDARQGDLVLYDWGGDGAPDHVGFVELNKGPYIQTIEGNTSSGTSGSQSNGGLVARRTRNWNNVIAIIAVPYDGSAASGSSSASGTITVDGHIGPATVTAWQAQRGTTQDGVISGQSKADKAAHERINAIRYDGGGSTLVKSIQTFLNGKGYNLKVDGYLGSTTAKAIQQFMRDVCGYKKHAIDGIIGPVSAANIQNSINAGYWR